MSKTKELKTECEKIKARSKEIQTQMKEMGYEFEVEHVRPMKNFYTYKLGAGGIKFSKESMLNRDEYNKSILNGCYEVLDVRKAKLDKIHYGMFAESKGGFTRLTITKKDGEVVFGKYNFGDGPFFKSLGIMKAALKAIGAELNG